MPISQILLTRSTGGSSPPNGTTFFWSGDANTWAVLGTPIGNSTYSDPTPANPNYVYPSYTGKTRNFTGSEWMASADLAVGDAWTSNTITIDFWFLPTANGVQLLSETSSPSVITGYHYSMLEIDSNGYVNARFYNQGYPSSAVVSQSPVTLNQWNHIYFTEDSQGGHSFELNGVPTNGNSTYTRLTPRAVGQTSQYFIIGLSDASNLGSTGRFQGKIGWLTISDYVVSSTYSATVSDFPAITTYTLAYGGSNTVNEGDVQTFNVSGTNIPNGTYYWTVATNAGDFTTASGEFTITSNIGSFTVTPTEDATTEGAETFTVSIRSGSVSGTVLATSDAVNITDTSLTQVAPFSLQFVQAQTDYLDVAASSDWALGTTWTIEFWSKAAKASAEDDLLTVMCQNYDVGGSIDLMYIGRQLQFNGARLAAEPSIGGVPFGSVSKITGNQGWGNDQIGFNLATTGGTGSGLTVDVGDGGSFYSNISINNPGTGYTTGDEITVTSVDNSVSETFTITASAIGVWTHVALVSDGSNLTLYYDGVSVYTGGAVGLSNSTDAIRIGARGPASFQRFDGKLAMIRIGDTAKYTAAFTPTTNYTAVVDTQLFLGSDTPLVDTSSANRVITNNGVTQSGDFPT